MAPLANLKPIGTTATPAPDASTTVSETTVCAATGAPSHDHEHRYFTIFRV